jgi:hypothetical protein
LIGWISVSSVSSGASIWPTRERVIPVSCSSSLASWIEAIIPAGGFDEPLGAAPDRHVHWASRADWYGHGVGLLLQDYSVFERSGREENASKQKFGASVLIQSEPERL